MLALPRRNVNWKVSCKKKACQPPTLWFTLSLPTITGKICTNRHCRMHLQLNFSNSRNNPFPKNNKQPSVGSVVWKKGFRVDPGEDVETRTLGGSKANVVNTEGEGNRGRIVGLREGWQR